MATRENVATGKADTTTNSSAPTERILRPHAPQLRTAEAILERNEQILDGMDRGVISPKMGEQMGQCLKTPISLGRLEISFLKMIQNFGRKAPVPRSAILRSVIGLKETIAPSDGEYIRAMLPDGK